MKIYTKTGDSGKTIVQQVPVVSQMPQITMPDSQTVVTPLEQNNAPEETPSEDDSKYITIKSPIIGTFYRKSSPDKPLFVEVGQTIAEGDVLCVIEAMKLFNEVSGKIIKVLVDDSSPVEFDQPLFLVDPS